MGLIDYTVAGGSLILIGACESLYSAKEALNDRNPSSSSPISSSPDPNVSPSPTSFSSKLTFSLISMLAFLSILNSLASLADSVSSKDNTGFALQLEVIAASLLFLLYSLLGISTYVAHWFRFPSTIIDLICLFAFTEEFLLFYTQSKDPTGVENRYYDLMLVPVTICLISTLLELKSSKSGYARLGRGVGLVSQGMWVLQMGFSFFSNLISSGCTLHEKSRGNYTIRCKGHMEYHHGRAIATLLFNCHLAVVVVLGVGLYAYFCRTYGIRQESMRYKPIGEVANLESDERFTLDSDGDDGAEEVKSVEMQRCSVGFEESRVNGNGPHA